jgi:hypothetical protein
MIVLLGLLMAKDLANPVSDRSRWFSRGGSLDRERFVRPNSRQSRRFWPYLADIGLHLKADLQMALVVVDIGHTRRCEARRTSWASKPSSPSIHHEGEHTFSDHNRMA